VLRLTFDEFWRLQRDPVSERELADAKAYLTGSFPLTIETPDAIAMQVLNVVFYGLPIEDLQTFRDRVNAVSVDDVQRVARAYLKPDRLSVVLVGNAATFGPSLKGVGFNTYETVELGSLDLTTADFKRTGGRNVPLVLPRFRPIGARPVAYRLGAEGPPAGSDNRSLKGLASVSPVSSVMESARAASVRQSAAGAVPINPQEGEKAKALLDRAIAAKGGLDKLRAIKRITARTSTSMTAPDGRTQDAESTTYLEYPNHVRVETKLPEASTLQVYDGERAWVRDPRGVQEVPPRYIRDLQTSLKRDTISLLLAAAQGTVRSRALPDVKDEAGKVHRALELSSTDLEPMVLYLDPETGLISKQTYVAGGPGQPLIEEMFSDYRPVDGVLIAYAARVSVAGKPALERHVSEITINPRPDPALFKRPAN
jgi:outer membrane lipoprotein-sorting protein